MKPKEAYSLVIFLGIVLLLYLDHKGIISFSHISFFKLLGGLFIAGLAAMSITKMVQYHR